MQTFRLIFIHLLVYGLLAITSIPLGWSAALLAVLLIWISVWDFLTFEIPDLAVLILTLSGVFALYGSPHSILMDGIVGGILWPLMFWIVAELYLKTRGVHGLGFGDVKLMAGIGLWCGAYGTIYVVLSAALAGLLVLSILAVVRSTSIGDIGQSKVAFGPFLCLSAWSVCLLGGSI
ncbi:A24 family peptidase [Ruegeria sp.]|uniref:prepilin peptidase n=1 Tax=Ruegeria sp. TaxID=1879320 RepID=UPI002324E2E3|nr:A24 family peptidase [Ruegeria sp.]MDA7966138.1 A24 family peptidase [Ruegeria sp.]